jgi:hypothetical protein
MHVRGNLVMRQKMGGGLQRDWTSMKQPTLFITARYSYFLFEIRRHSIGRLESQQRTMLSFLKKFSKIYL